jgi:lysophospholipid acyltransferase (LPLAT)-like uncharacterized protein
MEVCSAHSLVAIAVGCHLGGGKGGPKGPCERVDVGLVAVGAEYGADVYVYGVAAEGFSKVRGR